MRSTPIVAAAQQRAQPVQRVAGAAAVAVDLLLDAAADLVQRLAGQGHDVEGVQHGDGVVELVVDRVLVAVERIQRRHLHPSPERVGDFLRDRSSLVGGAGVVDGADLLGALPGDGDLVVAFVGGEGAV